eukprot:1157918-Pelagomonas_calceolata.AAC.4
MPREGLPVPSCACKGTDHVNSWVLQASSASNASLQGSAKQEPSTGCASQALPSTVKRHKMGWVKRAAHLLEEALKRAKRL